MPREIAIAIYPGFQLLDAAGPIAAFEVAERHQPGSYKLTIFGPTGGEIASSSGVRLVASPFRKQKVDTVMVVGGSADIPKKAINKVVSWLRSAKARRTTSVCSGAFFLAAAGYLDGRRATTHWDAANYFCRLYPNVRLESDRIFIKDGDVWTSAGVTAGIDLALALIEEDLGETASRHTAQQLVVHHRRPGGQSQFSALVEVGGRTKQFDDLIGWMREHLREPITVEHLAERAAMSPRNFSRVFHAETSTTPAKALERLRVDAARTAIETTHNSLEQIAESTGFFDSGRMRRAFRRVFGISPQALRRSKFHECTTGPIEVAQLRRE
jgi:transcriptional regulator GlxA family with amidase domain